MITGFRASDGTNCHVPSIEHRPTKILFFWDHYSYNDTFKHDVKCIYNIYIYVLPTQFFILYNVTYNINIYTYIMFIYCYYIIIYKYHYLYIIVYHYTYYIVYIFIIYIYILYIIYTQLLPSAFREVFWELGYI